MSDHSNSVVTRLVGRVFPQMPDFYGLVNEQCDLAVKTMDVFVAYMETGDEEKAKRVRDLEKEGDDLKDRSIDILNRAFATPMDREDIYRAIINVDHVINYAKTSVREMEVLDLKPDKYTLEIAELLRQGTVALQQGFQKLSTNPVLAEEDAQAARKAERNTEKCYRRAIVELFSKENIQIKKQENQDGNGAFQAMECVIEMFKRREIYRHMSNAADRIAWASEVLHDIVVKIS